MLASARGYYQDVRLLSLQGLAGASTLLSAVASQVVELAARDADLGARDKKRTSALHFASGRGRLELVQYFASKGLDLDVEDSSAPLMHARCPCMPTAPAALTRGSKGWQQTEDSSDAADRVSHALASARHCSSTLARAQGSRVRAGGRTPVHWAVLGNHPPVLDFLIKRGAYPDSYDAQDDSPLHLAARWAQGLGDRVSMHLPCLPLAHLIRSSWLALAGPWPLSECRCSCPCARAMPPQPAGTLSAGLDLVHTRSGPCAGCRAGHEALVRSLLGSAGRSNVGDVNARGLTPLGEALVGGHLPCADLLLKQVRAEVLGLERVLTLGALLGHAGVGC